MNALLKNIWRYPIKSHGREELPEIHLSENSTLPYDRCWAIAHEDSNADHTTWSECVNFSRGAKAPKLMAIDASLDITNEKVTLTHPELDTITVHPEYNSDELIKWVSPLMPSNRSQSERVVRVTGRGMTDTEYPSVSINSLSSHQTLEKELGHSLDSRRWRGNLWLEGLDAWEEFNWIGKMIAIGGCEIEILEPIQRCLATTANPETGDRDIDTLSTLKTWGHQDFGVYGRIVKSSKVEIGDKVSVL